jgi:hypothetical protein
VTPSIAVLPTLDKNVWPDQPKNLTSHKIGILIQAVVGFFKVSLCKMVGKN